MKLLNPFKSDFFVCFNTVVMIDFHINFWRIQCSTKYEMNVAQIYVITVHYVLWIFLTISAFFLTAFFCLMAIIFHANLYLFTEGVIVLLCSFLIGGQSVFYDNLMAFNEIGQSGMKSQRFSCSTSIFLFPCLHRKLIKTHIKSFFCCNSEIFNNLFPLEKFRCDNSKVLPPPKQFLK